MDNSLAFWQEQIRELNAQLIDSEIGLDDYRKNVEAIFSGMGQQMRTQFDGLTFS